MNSTSELVEQTLKGEDFDKNLTESPKGGDTNVDLSGKKYVKAASLSFDIVVVILIVAMLVCSAMFLTGKFFTGIPLF